jgi:hypothetical protein
MCNAPHRTVESFSGECGQRERHASIFDNATYLSFGNGDRQAKTIELF